MHHKRKGPKSTRSGCLLCKPHKRQGCKHAARRPKDKASRQDLQKARRELGV